MELEQAVELDCHDIIVHMPRSSFPNGAAAEAAVANVLQDMCKTLHVLGPKTALMSETLLAAEFSNDRPQANLGLATTRELLDEISARFDVNYFMKDGIRTSMLDYRTVDA